MSNYYTYYIRIANYDHVQVETRDPQNQDLGQPNGVFGYKGALREQIDELVTAAQKTIQPHQVGALGEALFNALFDPILRQNFVDLYNRVAHIEKKLLRVELDIDERKMPEAAALPWEFMRLPASANLGAIWLGTAPYIIFSRRRAQWHPPQPIQLKPDEKLRIAVVVAAPQNLSPVIHETIVADLQKLAEQQADRIALSPVVTSANPEKIDAVLLNDKPHILHFIGHGRLNKESGQPVGEIALVDDFDKALWVDADYFSELLNRHRPGVVLLQACEGGALSESEAFVGLASKVVAQNIPVVVAMQYEVTNSVASRFSRRFYERLAQDDPVDSAAQEGRRVIALGPNQYRSRDFATPVIFMRVRDGYLFQRQERQGPPSQIPPSDSTLPIDPPKNDDRLDLSNLRGQISQHFNEDELRDICFELNNELSYQYPGLDLNYENFSGGKNSRVLDLVQFCQRRGLILALRQKCYQKRPHIQW